MRVVAVVIVVPAYVVAAAHHTLWIASRVDASMSAAQAVPTWLLLQYVSPSPRLKLCRAGADHPSSYVVAITAVANPFAELQGLPSCLASLYLRNNLGQHRARASFEGLLRPPQIWTY